MSSFFTKLKETRLVKGMVYAIVGAFSYPGINIFNKLQVNGMEHLQKLPKQNVLFVSNHQTYFADVITFIHIFCAVSWRKKNGLGIQAEEQLFKAYFTDGKNIDDQYTLIDLGTNLGLDPAEVKQALESGAYANEVKHDIAQAQYLGIQGVPFFVLNNKYAISGAQAVSVFKETLEKAFGEWQKENLKPKLEIIEGESCGPDGNC